LPKNFTGQTVQRRSRLAEPPDTQNGGEKDGDAQHRQTVARIVDFGFVNFGPFNFETVIHSQFTPCRFRYLD